MNSLEVMRDDVGVGKDAAGSDCSMGGKGQVLDQLELEVKKVMA